MHEWSRPRTETIVACFINFYPDLTEFGDVLQSVLSEAHRVGYQTVHSTDPFRSSIRPSDHRCSITILAISYQERMLRNIDIERQLQRWNRFGLFIVIHTVDLQDQHMLGLSKQYGLGTAFYVQCCRYFKLKFPLIYYERVNVLDLGAVRYWVNFDQQKDVNGIGYFVLMSYNIPYLYRTGPAKISGIDFRFLTDMTRHQNASFVVHNAGSNVVHEKSFASMLENEMKQNKIIVNLQRSVGITLGNLVYLNEHDTQCILMTKQRIRNYFMHLLRPYNTAVWIVLFCLGVLLIVASQVMPTVFTHNYILAVFFGQAVEEHRLRTLDRFVIFIVGLIVFLLSEAYLAVMIEYMFNMKYEAELSSFEQFAAKNIPLYVSLDHYMILKKTAHKTKLQILLFDQNVPQEADEESVKTMYDPSRAHLVPCSHARWTVSRPYMRSQTDYQYYVIKESVYFRQQTFSVARNSLNREKMTDYTTRFTEGGFWTHWETLETEYLNRHEELESSGLLTFKSLISLFWILIYGNGLAMVGFLMEITYRVIAAPR